DRIAGRRRPREDVHAPAVRRRRRRWGDPVGVHEGHRGPGNRGRGPAARGDKARDLGRRGHGQRKEHGDPEKDHEEDRERLDLATGVFLVTYVLISLRNIRRFPIERPAVAMLGGALMLVLGVLTPADALLAINLDVLLLLVGMMVLVAGLDVCGFFDLVSSRIALRAKSQAWFLAWLMIATAALSALVLNDTIALLVTPVVVRSARALRVNPVPYL